MKTQYINLLSVLLCLLVAFSSCSFLGEQEPQGVLSDVEVTDPAYVDNLVISAYAIFISAEDINSSFSMWNYDVRSDDAYKGGNGTSDGDVFHQLEISQGILTTNWNISDMWQRLYNCISRVNAAIAVLEQIDDSYELKQQRLGEMRFLRAYAHFLLKRLYKNIPFVIDPTMSQQQYNELSNTQYTNDEGWALIAADLEAAFEALPEQQAEVGRVNKSAAAALLAKVYLYKAYRQDDPASHAITEVNMQDIQKVIEYTDPALYSAYGLEADIHNNFRPEPEFENGKESIWAMQYSMNDGTRHGNCNWSYGLIVPNIPGVTDGGCDFYKPSQNLVNAFRTDANGLPLLDTYNQKDYNKENDNADPRLFLTVGMPGFPYMFNTNFMMNYTATWSRSNGLYGYYVSLKHNVDPESPYLIKGAWWGSPMNRIVLRYSDVLLMRAEALAQTGETAEAMQLVNQVRQRAAGSTQMLNGYEGNYNCKILVKTYPTIPGKDEMLRIVKMERRLELALESERFFDLVRWGDAAEVLNKYYGEETDNCAIYSAAHFTANKNEYLPIPFAQVAASNGHYTQNIGGW